MNPTSCGVKTCDSTYQMTKDLKGEEAITYFRIPKNCEKTRLEWLDACERQNVQYVCSKHFETDVLIKDELKNSVSLKPGSIPTLNLPIRNKNVIKKPVARKSTGPSILKRDQNYKMDIEEELALMEESNDAIENIEYETNETDKLNLKEAFVLLSKCEIPENSKMEENKTCCVSDCRNKEDTSKKVSFHSFPRDPTIRRKWISWTKVNPKRADFYYICSEHFTLADYYDNNGLLRWYAVPSKKPMQDSAKVDTPEKSRSRLKSTHVVRQEFESVPETKIIKKPKKKEDDKKKNKLTGIRCAVQGCYTKQGDGLYFYPFPVEKPVRMAWLSASKYIGVMTDTTAICSKHFMSKDFVPMPGSTLPSTRLRRGTIPTKYLPSGGKNNRKRKILKESSSEDEDPESFLPPEVRRGLGPQKKDRKLTKKIEIVAEFDEDNDGSMKKNYKVVIKKIKRKGPEGERKRGLLVDCKSSLLLVKKIIEGLDITRMEEIKFKPGEVEESRVVLTGSAGTEAAPVAKNNQNFIRVTEQQLLNLQQQKPVYLVNQGQQVVLKTNPGTSNVQNVENPQTNEKNPVVIQTPESAVNKRNPEESSKMEEEMNKCHLSFELQRYKTSVQNQTAKIKALQQTKKILEKRFNNVKKMVEIARKGNFLTVFQDPSKPEV